MTGRTEASGSPVHTAIIDWDGTAVPSMWPERAMTFMPGFVDAMKLLHSKGWRITIFSARLSPYDPWTSALRPAYEVASEYQYVRQMLDSAGLTFIDIWRKAGKPGGDVYVDDKAERYGGRPGSWARTAEKILRRSGEAVFPAFDQDLTDD